MTASPHASSPVRLFALFLATTILLGIELAAGVSGYLVVQDLRDGRINRVAGTSALPDSNIKTPVDEIVVTPVATAAELEEIMGFAPFLPDSVPSSTDSTPKFAVARPNGGGLRVARVGYSAKAGASNDGVHGPMIVIGQAKGVAGEGVDGELKRIVSRSPALVATLACGDLVLDVQMYFGPDPAEGEEIVTSYMRDVASGFIDEVKEQCASGG